MIATKSRRQRRGRQSRQSRQDRLEPWLLTITCPQCRGSGYPGALVRCQCSGTGLVLAHAPLDHLHHPSLFREQKGRDTMPAFRDPNTFPGNRAPFALLFREVLREIINAAGFPTTTDILEPEPELPIIPHQGAGVDALVGLLQAHFNRRRSSEEKVADLTMGERLLVVLPRTLDVKLIVNYSVEAQPPAMISTSQFGSWKASIRRVESDAGIIKAAEIEGGNMFGLVIDHQAITRFIGVLRRELMTLRDQYKIKRPWKGDFDYSDRLGAYQNAPGYQGSGGTGTTTSDYSAGFDEH